MAYGDIGGPVTEIVVTCKAREELKEGQAVALVGHHFEVSANADGAPVFGFVKYGAGAGRPVTVCVRGVRKVRCETDGSNMRLGTRADAYMTGGNVLLCRSPLGPVLICDFDADTNTATLLF